MRVGAGRAVVAGGDRAPGRPATALRYATGHHRRQVGWLLRLGFAERGAAAGSLSRSSLAWSSLELAVPLWAERTGRRLAPAPHRRAVRPVHDHPARRERPGRVDRRAGGPSGRRLGAPSDHRGRRARAAVRALVAVLPRAGRRGAGRPPRPLVPLGLRALRHLRGARRAGRRPRGGGRADRAPPGGPGGRGRPTRSRSRSAPSWSCCGPCTRRSCPARSSGRR